MVLLILDKYRKTLGEVIWKYLSVYTVEIFLDGVLQIKNLFVCLQCQYFLTSSGRD